MTWQPFDPPEPVALPEDANLAALAAALRPVRAALEAVALRVLTAPGWQLGASLPEAAFIEGQKTVWRLLLRLTESERSSA